MSTKTKLAVALVLAMATTASAAASQPITNAAASQTNPDGQTIHWQQSLGVHEGSTAHAQLTRFLKQHASTSVAPQRDGVKGDFQVSFGHTLHGAPARQKNAYTPPYDPAAKGLYTKGDTLIAVTCLDGTRRSWHFVYEPASHDSDRLQWKNTSVSYDLLSPKGHCPPASQWLPDEANRAAHESSQAVRPDATN